tara:strand:- start:271 stop:4347 length:4077 start_codon:yes stop_codon:yes gene_type:complete
LFSFSQITLISQNIEDHNKDLYNAIFINKDSFNIIFEKYQSKFKNIDDQKNRAEYLSNKGYYNFLNKDFIVAEKSFTESLNIYENESFKDESRLEWIYYFLGQIYFESDREKSMKFFQKNIIINSKLESPLPFSQGRSLDSKYNLGRSLYFDELNKTEGNGYITISDSASNLLKETIKIINSTDFFIPEYLVNSYSILANGNILDSIKFNDNMHDAMTLYFGWKNTLEGSPITTYDNYPFNEFITYFSDLHRKNYNKIILNFFKALYDISEGRDDYAKELLTVELSVRYSYLDDKDSLDNYYFNFFNELRIKNLLSKEKVDSSIVASVFLNFGLSNDKNKIEIIKKLENGLTFLEDRKNLSQSDKENLRSFYLYLSSLYSSVGDSEKEKKYSLKELSVTSKKDYYDLFRFAFDSKKYKEAKEILLESRSYYKRFDSLELYIENFSIALENNYMYSNVLFNKDEVKEILDDFKKIQIEKKNDIEFSNDISNSLIEFKRLYFSEISEEDAKELSQLIDYYSKKVFDDELYLFDYTLAVNNLSTYYAFKKDYSKSIDLYEKAIDLLNSSNTFSNDGDQILFLYDRLLGISNLFSPENIIKYLSPILEIIKKNNLDSSLRATSIYTNIGKGLSLLGNKEDSYFYLFKALRNEEMDEDRSNVYPLIINYLIENYLTEKNFSQIEILIEQLNIYKDKNYYSKSIGLTDYYLLLSKVYLFKGEFEKSIMYYDSLNMNTSDLTSQYFSSNNLLYSFANAFKSGDIDQGIESIKNDESDGSILLFWLYFLKKDYSNAFKSYYNYLNNIIQTFNSKILTLSDAEKRSVFSSNMLDALSSLLIFNSNSESIKKYFEINSFYKSLVLYNSIKTLIRDNYNILDKKYINEYFLVNDKIESLYQNRSINSDTIESLNRRLREIQRVLSLDLSDKLENNTSYLDRVQEKLLADQAYVEIIKFYDPTVLDPNKSLREKGVDLLTNNNISFTDYGSVRYGAIIIKKEKEPIFIEIDNKNVLENRILKLYNSYVNGANMQAKDIFTYDYIFKSIDDSLDEINEIFISPDGVYNEISLLSLYNPTNNKYLIETHDITKVSGVRGFLNLDEGEIFNFEESVLIGDVNFSYNLDYESSITDQKKSENFNSKISLDTILTRNGLEPLPGTLKEINLIENMFVNNNIKSTKFIGENASETNIKNIESPDILHIATHGYFLREQPNINNTSSNSLLGNFYNLSSSEPYLNSGLFLAGAKSSLQNSNFNAENGVFSALEARNLNLENTKLVVLSACETGRGSFVSGEGVFGLQRAFLEAGSKNVIMTLWKIDDNITTEFMNIFYENLIQKKENISKSLRNAQIFIKNKYESPFYWGAFTLIEN